jgi:type II secretory pathway component GspD/PulD (secretin)
LLRRWYNWWRSTIDTDLDNVPIVDSRSAVSTVTVRDEEVLAFGGLRQFDSTKSESGVPWLLRAPVIGWLFRGSLNDEQRKSSCSSS